MGISPTFVTIVGLPVERYSPNFVGKPPADCKLLGRAKANTFALLSSGGISSREAIP
jgi:hypothetical protein